MNTSANSSDSDSTSGTRRRGINRRATPNCHCMHGIKQRPPIDLLDVYVRTQHTKCRVGSLFSVEKNKGEPRRLSAETRRKKVKSVVVLIFSVSILKTLILCNFASLSNTFQLKKSGIIIDNSTLFLFSSNALLAG